MRSRCVLALPVSIALLACDRERSERPPPTDSGPASDTGPSYETEPLCDSGYLDDDGECVPAACGTGTWGDLETDASTVFVDIAARVGGNGSQLAPLTSIQAGLDAVGAAGGGMVAVAAGSYPETLELSSAHGDVQLAGRCQELVLIDASVGDQDTPGIAVDPLSAQVGISGVTVSGARWPGLIVGSGAVTVRDASFVGNEYVGVVAMQVGAETTSLELESCVIEGNELLGVLAVDSGTAVSLRETRIVDSQPLEDETYGYGVQVHDGATLAMDACQVTGNYALGLCVGNSGTTVTLRDTSIQDTQPGQEGGLGYGIEVSLGASLILEGCTLSGNTGAGISALSAGTAVTLRETVIQDTWPGETGMGYGIEVDDGAFLETEECVLSRNTGIGVSAEGLGTAVELRATTVQDCSLGKGEEDEVGILVKGGASLEADSCDVAGNTYAGAAAIDAGSLTLRHSLIQDTQPDESGETGWGLVALGGATLVAESCEVLRNVTAGVAASGFGTSVFLRETTVQDTHPGVVGDTGFGIGVGGGASLAMESCHVEGNYSAGVLATGTGTSATLLDTSITATMNDDVYTAATGLDAYLGARVEATGIEVTSTEGPGIYVVQEGTWLRCSDCLLRDNQFAGAVLASDASLELIDSTIEGTSLQENLGGGVGIYAEPWAGGPPTLTVSGSLIQDNPIAGLWLSGAGSYTITGNTIGGGEGWARASLTKCGDAVFARDGVALGEESPSLLLEGNLLQDGQGAGLFLDNASAALSGNSYADNAVDLVSQGSGCSSAPQGYESELLGTAELCPYYDYAVCGDEFMLYLALAQPASGLGVARAHPWAPGAGGLWRSGAPRPPVARGERFAGWPTGARPYAGRIDYLLFPD